LMSPIFKNTSTAMPYLPLLQRTPDVAALGSPSAGFR
jgi:hypothetical protein